MPDIKRKEYDMLMLRCQGHAVAVHHQVNIATFHIMSIEMYTL